MKTLKNALFLAKSCFGQKTTITMFEKFINLAFFGATILYDRYSICVLLNPSLHNEQGRTSQENVYF